MSREELLDLVEKYVDSIPPKKFIPGETYIPPSAKVVGAPEVRSIVDAALDMHFTEGRYAKQFDKDFRLWLDHQIRHVILCNSGSSANLLAVSAITQPEFGSKKATKGSEVITVAAGFPTTVNPIIQNGLTPIFLDVELGTLVPKPEEIEHAVNPNTKAIVLANPLGNLPDLDAIRDIADEYGIFYIEDNCDGLGGDYKGKQAGTAGDLSTLSFYPAHHITAGEAGAVLTNSPMMKKVVESLRDWGRDCWCDTGKENTCGKRFGWKKCGSLPDNYDHKYIYSRIGYNLKTTDLQASILCEQLKRLDGFVAKRRYNWQRLRDALDKYSHWLIMPRATEGANPSWFGFHMTVKDVAPFTRHEIVAFLEEKKIGTRLFFGGNLLWQPAYKGVHHKVHSELFNTGILARGCFWIGVHPAIDDKHLDYMISMINLFFKEKGLA